MTVILESYPRSQQGLFYPEHFFLQSNFIRKNLKKNKNQNLLEKIKDLKFKQKNPKLKFHKSYF